MITNTIFRVLGFIGLVLYPHFISGQSPDSLWQDHYGGNNEDYGFDVLEGTPGEYIFTGRTKSFGNGLNDGYILKLDSKGDVVWEKAYGGPLNDAFSSICPAHDGGYILAGVYSSFPEGGSGVWTLWINEQGDSVTSRTYLSYHDSWGLHIAPTNDQGYIISGVLATGFGVGDEVYLIKLNAEGDTMWTGRYGLPHQDYGEEAIQTSDGGYIVAGRTYSSYTPESCDAWVIRTDANGDTLWTRKYGGDNEDMFSSLVETDDGYIFAGNSESFGDGKSEFWAVRTNDNGDTIWSRTYGNDTYQLCYRIMETAQGNYVLGGYAGFLRSSFDTYLVEIDPNGNLVWEAGYGHPESNEIMYGFGRTSDGGYIATGHTTYYAAYKDELVALKLGPAGSGGNELINNPRYTLKVTPNPCNSVVTVCLGTHAPVPVNLAIYNALGMKLKDVLNRETIAGKKQIEVDVSCIPAGIFYFVMTGRDERIAAELLILR